MIGSCVKRLQKDFVIYSYLKDGAFTAVKGDAKIETRCVKRVPFVNRRCTKEVPSLSKMVYKRVRGRTLGRNLPV